MADFSIVKRLVVVDGERKARRMQDRLLSAHPILGVVLALGFRRARMLQRNERLALDLQKTRAALLIAFPT